MPFPAKISAWHRECRGPLFLPRATYIFIPPSKDLHNPHPNPWNLTSGLGNLVSSKCFLNILNIWEVYKIQAGGAQATNMWLSHTTLFPGPSVVCGWDVPYSCMWTKGLFWCVCMKTFELENLFMVNVSARLWWIDKVIFFPDDSAFWGASHDFQTSLRPLVRSKLR